MGEIADDHVDQIIAGEECEWCGELNGEHAKDCEALGCDHEGHVVKGRCEKCGEAYESDKETYSKENPR